MKEPHVAVVPMSTQPMHNRAITPEICVKPIALYHVEEYPEELMARPHTYRDRVVEHSPTKELMDMHHDMDDLTAHKHQMIKVYQR